MKKKKLKRSNFKRITKEAQVLRFMRKMRKISMREAGLMIDMSGTFVSHIEHGRIDVKAQDIRKFLKAYCFTADEFENYMATSEEVISDYREDLYRMILKMSDSESLRLYNFAKTIPGI